MTKIIREVELKDIQYVYDIDQQVFASEGYPLLVLRQMYELYCKTFFVLLTNNQIVGYCIGAPVADNRTIGWIICLAISNGFSHKGFGKSLLLSTITALKKQGCDEVRLTVRPDNTIAKTLFKKSGFEVVEVDDEYFGPMNPREVMRVVL